MITPYWVGGNRRIIDLSGITHIMITTSGVTIMPISMTLPHSDGAALIWELVTPPWKKIYVRVINKWHTESLKIEHSRILNIILEAIEG